MMRAMPGRGGMSPAATLFLNAAVLLLCQQLTAPILIGGDLRGANEVGIGEEAGHPLLAAADLELLGVVVLAPPDRQFVLFERGIEGGQVAVPLGVGQDAVTIEDQCGHSSPRPAGAAEQPDVVAGGLHNGGPLVAE